MKEVIRSCRALWIIYAASAAVGERGGTKKNPRCQIFHVICPVTNQRECLEEERCTLSSPDDGWMDFTAVQVPVARGGGKKNCLPCAWSVKVPVAECFLTLHLISLSGDTFLARC